jgi:hypothetical protein
MLNAERQAGSLVGVAMLGGSALATAGRADLLGAALTVVTVHHAR